MDIRNLEYFYTTAKMGNFTRAAESLSVSQPALSSGIKNLERELKCVLLKRGKKISLTAEGEKLHFYCSKLFTLLKEMKEDIALTSKGIKGIVKSGILESLLLYVFPKIIAQYSKNHPEVIMKFEKSETAIIEKKVVERALDFGIISRPSTSTKLESIVLASYYHCLVCSKKDKRTLAEQIIDKPLYVLGDWQIGVVKANTNLLKRFPDVKILNPVNCVLMLREIVSNGLGLAILPSYVIKKDIRVIEEYPDITMQANLIIRKNRIKIPTIENFIKYVIGSVSSSKLSL